MPARTFVVVLLDAFHCSLQDLGSTNGTYLNGIRLRPFISVALFPGMQVHLGTPSEGQNFEVFFLREKIKRKSSTMIMVQQKLAPVVGEKRKLV